MTTGDFSNDRGFHQNRLSNLPSEYRFGKVQRPLVVDYAKNDQLESCRKMIKAAAARGDNVGVDEYEEDGDNIGMLLELADIFQASDPVSGSVEAFMFIQPCLYQRSYDSCTASVYVFRSGDVDDVVYAELMSLTAEFAKAIDVGYTQCFTHVALCFPFLHLELRRQGFSTVAVLPDWVEIAEIGLGESSIMMKGFGLPERPIKSPTAVQDMMATYFAPESVTTMYTNACLPQVPGLPKIIPVDKGRNLIVRNFRKEDDQLLYHMFKNAVEKGEGYSVHEIPSLDALRLAMLAKGFAAAIEDEKTREVIGYFCFQDSAMSRRGKRKIADDSIIIKAEFRGMGYGNWSLEVSNGLLKTIGYKLALRETFITNYRSLKVWKNHGQIITGVLPRCAYQMGVGWIDLLLSVKDLDKLPDTLSKKSSL